MLETQRSGTTERPITAPDTAVAHSVTFDSDQNRSFNLMSSSGIPEERHPQTTKNSRRRRRIKTLEVAAEKRNDEGPNGEMEVLAVDQPGRFVIHEESGNNQGSSHQRYSSWSQI